jgi:hypothetical protein
MDPKSPVTQMNTDEHGKHKALRMIVAMVAVSRAQTPFAFPVSICVHLCHEAFRFRER